LQHGLGGCRTPGADERAARNPPLMAYVDEGAADRACCAHDQP
jgi:hypothetical protein